MSEGCQGQGTVVEFDERRGLGLIVADDGTRFGFHCTAIADGTRTIAIGTSVCFDAVPGHLGQGAAAGIAPARSARPS